MDTRTKILTAAQARQIAGPVTLATGYFDVLRAEQLRALEAQVGLDAEHPARLVVAVLPLDGALLEQRARAEMVASLRMVDYVITASDSELDELIQALQPRRVVRLESEHTLLARELRKRVHRRPGNPAPAR